MSVRISGPESPARLALDEALTIAGVARTDNTDDTSVTIVLPGIDASPSGACVYFGEVSPAVARRFGVERTKYCSTSLVHFTCCEPTWSKEELSILDLASREAHIPCGDRVIARCSEATSADTLLSDSGGNPLVLRSGRALWCTVNLPDSLSILLGERYLPERTRGASEWLAAWRPLQQLYYHAPRRLRSYAQRRMIHGLEQRLEQQPADQFRSSYPIDGTGWLLVRAIVNLIRIATGPLPFIDAWPEGFRACVVVTHDIEPTRYSYLYGLPRLLDWLKAHRVPPHTINPVAFSAKRHSNAWKRAEMGSHEVGCHGWLHDGRETRLPRERMVRRIVLAKSTIESLVGRSVTSFRSPRLDRNDLLYETLDNCGFTCDSTLPDVDRENTDRWGGGCTLNFPFHPIVRQSDGWRRLNLLECPVTAPDCAMPIFSGCTEQETAALYARKLDWIEAVGGCYVAIFHPGVFDHDDGQLRQRLLHAYYKSLQGRHVWRATLRDLERWWRIRGNLSARVVKGAPVLINEGATETFRVMLRWQDRSWIAPPLAPGDTWSPANQA